MIGKLHHPNIVPDLRRGRGGGPALRRHPTHPRRAHAVGYCRPGSLLPIDQVVQIVYKCAKRCTTRTRAAWCTGTSSRPTILLTQDGGTCASVDFGIALVSDSEISRLEGVAGSPAYMSARAGAGPSTRLALPDLYSLARSCTRCCAASGRSAPARSASCCAGVQSDARALRRRAPRGPGGTRGDRGARPAEETRRSLPRTGAEFAPA